MRRVTLPKLAPVRNTTAFLASSIYKSVRVLPESSRAASL